MRFVQSLLICLAGAMLPAVAQAEGLSHKVPPHSWLDPILPEDLPPLQYPAYADDLDKAKLESFTGRYKKSLLTIYNARDANPIETGLVKADSLSALGRHQEAIEILSKAPLADDPRAQIARAGIFIELHQTDDSIAQLKSHLQKYPQSFAAHYWLGFAYEQIGDLEKAREIYGWFVAPPQDLIRRWVTEREKRFENAEEVTLMARGIDRWAALTGSYQNLPNLHDTLLNMFVRAYDVIDRSYWPAHVAAAEYFLWHDNAVEAKIELKAALAANPNCVAAWKLRGLIALGEYDFDAADAAIAAIRKVESDSLDADLLQARNLLQERRPADAQKLVDRALARQPRNLEALGLFAAVHALQLKDDKTQEVLKRVEEIDPDNATAYFEVAQQLGAMRQYPRAAAMYNIAVERAPWWTAPRNGLGLLHTQSGEEELAQAVLDAAHELDPFNLQTTNYLRLLDDLKHFAKKETAHFVVMYDQDLDPLIPEYFAEYLESVYPQVVAAYKHEPSVKTLIEVFPTHDAFSVRTTGSPWIGTVGASTGRVIAMVAPRKGEMTMGPFNWAQVLRHEFTHTVTLSATDNRIPHWMTEGLAVLEEQTPMRWEWVPMMYRAVTKDELFTMDNLTWGFIRPKRPGDRSLAYAQSFWVCKFIQEKYGPDAILRMLDEFRNGATQDEVFPKVLGCSLSEFTSEFFGWAKSQVATWGYDEQTTKKYDQLRERGEGLIKSRQFDEAVKVWEEIATIRPVDALPHQRLAGLYLSKQVDQPQKAIEHLTALHAVELKDNRYAKRIARAYRDLNQLQEAQRFASQAVYIEPYELDAHQLLAEIYEKAGNQAELGRERRVIAVLEKWLAAERKRMQINPDQN